MTYKPTVTIVVSETEEFPPFNEDTVRMAALTTSTQGCAGGSSLCLRREQEIKCMKVGKEEVKLSLCAVDMIVYMKSPVEFTKQLLQLISGFSKIAGCK